MKYLLTPLKTAVLVAATVLVPTMGMAASDDVILKKIEDLESKVKGLETQLETTGTAAANSGSLRLGNSAIENLTIKGDLRLRFENRNRDYPSSVTTDDDTRNRFRTRLRIGGIWANEKENWEIGVGVASGSNTARSTNDTWSQDKVFESGDLRLDYAYAKHTFGAITMTAGQHKNPYKRSWLYWDSDIRPVGVTLQYGEKTGAFATGGAYSVNFDGNGTNNPTMMYATQLGWKTKIKKSELLVAAGVQLWDTDDSLLGNAAGSGKYDFNVGDIYAHYKTKHGIVKMTYYSQMWQNFGADGAVGEGVLGGNLDPKNEDLGWILGVVAKVDKWRIKAAYAYVEADSLMGGITDADFGTGISDTDVKGTDIRAAYSFTKNWSCEVTSKIFESIERSDQPQVSLTQLDLKYKF